MIIQAKSGKVYSLAYFSTYIASSESLSFNRTDASSSFSSFCLGLEFLWNGCVFFRGVEVEMLKEFNQSNVATVWIVNELSKPSGMEYIIFELIWIKRGKYQKSLLRLR